MSELNPIIRFAFLLSGALFIYCLFHYGAQPIAVGLFASPIDKIAHAGVFGLIAMMLWFVFDRRYPLLIISLVAITGAADEIHQLFLPGRSADVSDWIADVSGACLPIIVLIASRKKNSKGMGSSGIKAN
ncbi:MAG: VanZ family protein [Gallionellaceae bacterium]|nr:VanZ family protein [Gallionellaceae bacterium]